MGLLDMLRAPRQNAAPAIGFQVLVFGPAILRMSLCGKDATTELDALAEAVAKLGFPARFSSERVFASAAEMARKIKVDGVAGVTERIGTELSADERRGAMRLALTAVFCSPLRDSGDIGILAGMAERIGMDKAEFETLFEEAKVAARAAA